MRVIPHPKTPPWCPECGTAVRYRLRTTVVRSHIRPVVGDRPMRYDQDVDAEAERTGLPVTFVRCSITPT